MTMTADNWDTLIDDAVALRRDLHRRPELPWSEHETARTIRAQLTALGIRWRACADTGTVATLAADRTGRHVALRADIDALPIEERSGVEWRSQIEGCMHACGHDGHSATLYATAAWLSQHEAELPGPVSLIFQPAEEGGHGAKRMIEDGALEGVDAIFGWHNWPAISYGRAVCPDGTVMAGNGTFRIVLEGRGGHSSQPELCRDPVLAGSAVVLALQQIVSRRLAPQQSVVLSVTSFDGRSGLTVVPDRAVLEGSFRLGDPGVRELLHALITEISESTAASYGVECEVELSPRYQPTVNHDDEAARFRQALEQEFGPEALSTSIALPVMASEDFSYYLNEIPGAFALIGSDDGQGPPHPCHSPEYDFNDALIPHVARLYSHLAGIDPAPTN